MVIMMDLRKVFGRNLRYYRLLNNYTQEIFADITDTSISYISNVENGKYGPSFDKITMFSKKLNIEPSLLFEKNIKKRDDN